MPYTNDPEEMRKSNPDPGFTRGKVIEEIWLDGYGGWEPHLQAIVLDDKHHGRLALRFCYWNEQEDGSWRFAQTPMCVYSEVLDAFREELTNADAPILEMLLNKLQERRTE